MSRSLRFMYVQFIWIRGTNFKFSLINMPIASVKEKKQKKKIRKAKRVSRANEINL